MILKSNSEKVNLFLEKNNLKDVYVFLVVSMDDLRCRGNLLGKNIADLRDGLQALIQEISKNPNVSYSNKRLVNHSKTFTLWNWKLFSARVFSLNYLLSIITS